MIENLLSYSEWQARRGELDIGEFRLAPLVHAVTESYQLPLTTHRLRLETSIEDITLRADRTRLRLVIDNLVSNAIKFSPEGGTIHVRAGVEGTEAVIDVADAGPGIASEERVRIFEPFFQGATPQGGLVRGTGIGLSVVQEFVHAHGGRVELVDGDLPGAHFRVHLPLDTVARSASA